MSKRNKILYCLLICLIILFVVIIVVVIDNNKIIKYDDYKINQISNYLEVNSLYYDGIQENIKTLGNNIMINEIDDIELNKQIASYVITNVVANIDYGYDECNACFKYFSQYDNIRFYDSEDIDYIYNQLYDGELKKITQEDLIDFNILYYNEEIDKYYINIVFNSYKPLFVFEFKDYIYEDDMLYMDYYYSKILYDDMEVKSDEDSEKIYLSDMNDVIVNELMYTDLYNDDNIIINIGDYFEYFDVIRYVFKYNKEVDMFKLYQMKVLED